VSESTTQHTVAARGRTWCLAWTFALCVAAPGLAAEINRVFNGSFESSQGRPKAPVGWSAAGYPIEALALELSETPMYLPGASAEPGERALP